MIACHLRAKTTFNIRKENKENLTLKQQAKKYNLNVSTIFKWKHREYFNDAPHGAIKSSIYI